MDIMEVMLLLLIKEAKQLEGNKMEFNLWEFKKITFKIQ